MSEYLNSKIKAKKMENIINKAMCSKTVQAVAAAHRLKEVQVWSLFFDSGYDYLDQLRHRITNHSVFQAQFGELLSVKKLKQTPNETFRSIMNSPHFWDWWSSQLWRVCYNHGNESETEIYIRLMFNTSLIPQNTLEKIFANEKRQENSSQPTGVQRGIKHRAQQVC